MVVYVVLQNTNGIFLAAKTVARNPFLAAETVARDPYLHE